MARDYHPHCGEPCEHHEGTPPESPGQLVGLAIVCGVCLLAVLYLVLQFVRLAL